MRQAVNGAGLQCGAIPRCPSPMFHRWRLVAFGGSAMKQCSKCRGVYDESHFHKHRATRDGLQYACKLCQAEHTRKSQIAFPERHNANTKRSSLKFQSQHGISRASLWMRNNKDKRRLYNKAYYALRRKQTPPDTCSMCGVKSSDIHAHHIDYNKPLEVVWLCRECHLAEHGKMARV